MAFPSVLNTFNRPSATDRLNSPSHSALHNTVSSALGQVEAVIGVDGANSVLGTIIGDLRSPGSGGGGHVQTANKGGTGQTSYTKGDILVATSASVLTKLAVGADGAVLQANSSVAAGINWKAGQVTISSFLTSSVWSKPVGLSYVEVHLWGGGGSGGSHNNTWGGGGGGGGSFNYGTFAASLLGATEQVNIGLGGASVAGGSASGNVGGNTVFGASSILTAFGGGGGGGGNVGTAKGAGGGGGGTLSAGVSAVTSVAGIGGRPGVSAGTNGGVSPGDRNVDNHGGGGGGGQDSSGGFSYFGGGGGGTGASGGGASNAGGNTIWAGGGGGGGATSGSSSGGTSRMGGAGGNGGINGAGSSGSQPGGGGGGSFNATSGNGANGKAIIYEYY